MFKFKKLWKNLFKKKDINEELKELLGDLLDHLWNNGGFCNDNGVFKSFGKDPVIKKHWDKFHNIADKYQTLIGEKNENRKYTS